MAWARTAAVAAGAGAAGAALGPAVGPALWAGGRAAAGALAAPPGGATGGDSRGLASVEALLAQVLAQQRGPGTAAPAPAGWGLGASGAAALALALAGAACCAASWSPGDLWFVSRGAFKRGLRELDSRLGTASAGLERAWRSLQEQSARLGSVAVRQEEGLEEQARMGRRLEGVGAAVEGLGEDVRELHTKVDSGNRGMRLLCQALFYGAFPSPAELEQLGRELGLPDPGRGGGPKGPRPFPGLKEVPSLAQTSPAGVFAMRGVPSDLWTRVTYAGDDEPRSP